MDLFESIERKMIVRYILWIMCPIKSIFSFDLLRSIWGSVFSAYPFIFFDCKDKCTLSYYQYQNESMNH